MQMGWGKTGTFYTWCVYSLRGHCRLKTFSAAQDHCRIETFGGSNVTDDGMNGLIDQYSHP